MKKILLYTVMIALGISLTGCGSTSKETSNNSKTNQAKNNTQNSKANSLEKNELIELTNEKVAIEYSNSMLRSTKNIRGNYRHISNDNKQDTLIFEIMNDKNVEDDLNKETKIFITTQNVKKDSVKLENIANHLLDLRNRVTKLSFTLPDTENYGDWAFTETKDKVHGRDAIVQEGTLSCFGKKYSNYVAYEFYLEEESICEVFVASPFYKHEKLRETAEIMIATFEEQQQSAYS